MWFCSTTIYAHLDLPGDARLIVGVELVVLRLDHAVALDVEVLAGETLLGLLEHPFGEGLSLLALEELLLLRLSGLSLLSKNLLVLFPSESLRHISTLADRTRLANARSRSGGLLATKEHHHTSRTSGSGGIEGDGADEEEGEGEDGSEHGEWVGVECDLGSSCCLSMAFAACRGSSDSQERYCASLLETLVMDSFKIRHRKPPVSFPTDYDEYSWIRLFNYYCTAYFQRGDGGSSSCS